jgi:DMSO/TMAO reductase YedYZ molybdopterin-dependent catalytic subunit
MAVAATAGVAATATGRAAFAAPGPIVKPLPPELFTVHGTNAETRWESLSGQGNLVPIDRFFVRNHTSTPIIDAATWRLRLSGTGLHNPISFTYRDLRSLPTCTVETIIECAGNGRSFYASQQGQSVSGTPWKLGAVGLARWRGVRLSTVLKLAGLKPSAVDILPVGLDPEYVTGGVNYGRVRRPLPVEKALDDTLIAYEMNGEPLPPDHGFPARLVVPSWVGIASIKWLGEIEVADTPLFSPWNTQFYRLVGPTYPPEGTLVTEQVTKSAFELPWGATLPLGQRHILTGRSWSPSGRVRRLDVSTDGVTWHRAIPQAHGPGWQRWEFPWHPTTPGQYTLQARATDPSGTPQPVESPYNTQGYLFGAIVRHPVTIT